MADMVPDQTDVNSQVADAASSSAEAQVDVANTPTVENTGANKLENKIPQGRFNEVVKERNSEREARERLESRIRQLEAGSQEGAFKRKTVADLEVERLVKNLQMDEKAAREIVVTYENLSASQRREQEAAQSRFRAESWANQKAEKDPVYREIEPELDKSFSSLAPEMQSIIAQNADVLEMFYENIKAKHLSGKSKDAYSKGADDAYKNKAAKQAVSSTPGSSSSVGKTELTRESIRKMSTAEFTKRQSEINEAILSGKLKK